MAASVLGLDIGGANLKAAHSAGLARLMPFELWKYPAGLASALLFSCNGRGTRLFEAPDHDAGVVRQEAGPIPVAGLFAMGELGPVGSENFIHGFTASVVLFEE